MPPFIRGVSFADAVGRFRLIGWQDDGQEGSHFRMVHPNMPGVKLNLPNHRGQDLAPATLGKNVEDAGLTERQFASLTGSGHRRNARQIRRGVYGMED